MGYIVEMVPRTIGVRCDLCPRELKATAREISKESFENPSTRADAKGWTWFTGGGGAKTFHACPRCQKRRPDRIDSERETRGFPVR